MNRVEREQLDLRVSATRAKLRIAFKSMRRQGYAARANFMCCMGCATSALDIKGKKGGVYWHRQSDDHFKEDGELYIGFFVENDTDDSKKVAEALVATLKAEGLWVEWNGSGDTKVMVKA